MRHKNSNAAGRSNLIKSLLMTVMLMIFCLSATSVFAQLKHRRYSLENDKQQMKELIKQERSKFLDQANVDNLKRGLKSSDMRERMHAVGIIGFFPESNLNGDVENLLLKDDSPDVRRKCAETLQMIGDKKSIPALISALNDSDDGVIQLSALALASLGEKEKCSAAVRKIWKKGSKDTPYYSCHFIFRDLGTQEAIDNLVFDLNNEDPYVAVNAAICLAQMGQSGKAFPALKKALKNEDFYVRMAGLRGLAYIGDAASLDLIKAQANDGHEFVRERVEQILEDF